MSVRTRLMQDTDQDAVLGIYAEGIASGHATFTSIVPSWPEWDKTYLPNCRVVATKNEDVIGWVALKPVSTRPVYRGVTDISIYVASSSHGTGVGKRLMADIIDISEAEDIWTIRAHMFPESYISKHLHETFGFRTVGISEKAGKMENGPFTGVWRDVRLMERRSKRVGIE